MYCFNQLKSAMGQRHKLIKPFIDSLPLEISGKMLNIYYFDQDIGPVTQKEPLKPNFIQAKKIDELIPSLDDAYNPKNIPHYSSKVINDFVIQ